MCIRDRYITHLESFEAADNLASTIRIGALSVELSELQSKTVGAQLGQTAISTSVKAGIIGLICVFIFMCIVYRIPGLAASLALVVYTELMLALINAFDPTLTLPGIAGIILSIGMAVDANVIIFARIREELATGKTVKSATKIGFQKALSAIVDGNITTLIAALVLGIKGTGSVKGFAQTLGPVSYTHLDVYKRQVPCYALPQSSSTFAYRGIIILLLCSYRGGPQGPSPTYEQAHVGLDLLALASYPIL